MPAISEFRSQRQKLKANLFYRVITVQPGLQSETPFKKEGEEQNIFYFALIVNNFTVLLQLLSWGDMNNIHPSSLDSNDNQKHDSSKVHSGKWMG